MLNHARRRHHGFAWVTLAGTAALGLCAAAAAPTSKPAATRPTSTAAVPAGYTAVRRGTLQLSFDVDGVFEPVDPFEVRFNPKHYQGELTVRKAVANGTTVGKGDLLLSLDTDPIDRQIAAAESAVSVANAAVAKAESDVALGGKADAVALNAAKQAVADGETGLKRWDQADGQAVAQSAGLQVQEIDAAVDDATDELDQLRQMYKSEDLTNQTADIVMKRAVRQVDVYKTYDKVAKVLADRTATYETAVHRHGLASAVAGSAVSVEQLQAAQAQERVSRDAALTAARAAAATADRDLADLKQDRAALTVTSPIDGLAVYGTFAEKAWQPLDPRRLAVGEKLSAGQIVVTVYQPGKLRVTAACPEAKLPLMPAGTPVGVVPALLGDVRYDAACGPAAVVPSSSKADATVDVPVALPQDVDRRLAPGYAAAVSVDVPAADGVLLVPASAVYHGKVSVHQPDGHNERRVIAVGRTDGEQVEIRSGLAEGEVVLTKAKG